VQLEAELGLPSVPLTKVQFKPKDAGKSDAGKVDDTLKDAAMPHRSAPSEDEASASVPPEVSAKPQTPEAQSRMQVRRETSALCGE
jgi:hypothetical protein